MFTQKLEQIVDDLKQEARQEGMQKGRLSLFQSLLEDKFGRLSPETYAQVQEADDEQILNWSRRMMTARTLQEVFS